MPALTRLPPGPRPLLGSENVRRFQGDQIAFLQAMANAYGPVCSFRLGPRRLVLVNEPRLVRQLLVLDHSRFRKGRFFELAKPFLGEGLLRSEGEAHARQRRLLMPLFHRARLQEYGQVMAECARDWAAGVRPGEPCDMAAEMHTLTLRIAGLTLLDTDLASESRDIGEALGVMLNLFVLINQPLRRLFTRLPRSAHQREVAGAVAVLDQSIQAIIARQRRQGPTRPNLIHHLLSLDGEDAMTDRQIRDEALTFFLAGQETTANAMAWTWHLLARHPRVEARLQHELTEVLGGRPPTPDDVPNLVYTRKILTESMRLYPPAWILGRIAREEYRLDDYALSANTVFLMSPWLMHRDARFYDDPLQFRPERWSEAFKTSLPKFAYFPFGGGARNCIGEAFAWLEGVLLLATIAQRWRFAAVPGHPVATELLVTLRPKYGLKMVPSVW